MSRNLLERHLRLSRQGLEFLPDDPGFDTWSNDARAKAFPGIPLSFQIRQIRSYQRRWEYVPFEQETWIVADKELSISLAEMKLLVASDEWTPEATAAFLQPIMGDAFRETMQPSYYAMCVKRAAEQSAFLRGLRHDAYQSKGRSASSVIAYLHELAHLVVTMDHPVAIFWRQSVEIALEKFAANAEIMATTAEKIEGLQLPPEITLSDLTTPHFQNQQYLYASRIRSSADLRRECVCDILAAVGFLNLLTERDLFFLAPTETLPMSLRQLGDALLTVAETLKHMQLLAAVQSFVVDQAKDKNGALGIGLVDLTSRSNVAVFLINLIFQVLGVDQNAIHSSGFDRELTEEQSRSLLLSSVRRRYAQIDTRITNPFEEFSAFLQDNDRFETAYITDFGKKPDPDLFLPDPETDRLRSILYSG